LVCGQQVRPARAEGSPPEKPRDAGRESESELQASEEPLSQMPACL